LPRPRIRKDTIEHANYYPYREHLITFLEDQDEKHRKAS